MRKHRKRWSLSEKLEIIGNHPKQSVPELSLEYGVSAQSIYTWLDQYEKDGESGLTKQANKSAETARIKQLERELKEYKQLLAESEMRNRIKAELLKKSESRTKKGK